MDRYQEEQPEPNIPSAEEHIPPALHAIWGIENISKKIHDMPATGLIHRLETPADKKPEAACTVPSMTPAFASAATSAKLFERSILTVEDVKTLLDAEEERTHVSLAHLSPLMNKGTRPVMGYEELSFILMHSRRDLPFPKKDAVAWLEAYRELPGSKENKKPASANPFAGRTRIPMDEFSSFLQEQHKRTFIRETALHKALPEAARQAVCLSTFINYRDGAKKIGVPGVFATAVWDAYEKIPSWDQPVKASEALAPDPFDGRLKILMNIELAAMQIRTAYEERGMKLSTLKEKLSLLNMSLCPLTTALYHKSYKSKSFPRIYAAYAMACIEGLDGVSLLKQRRENKPAQGNDMTLDI